MVEELFFEDVSKIRKLRARLEKELNVTIGLNSDGEVKIEGKEEDEYIAEKVLNALGFGFSLDKALLLKAEDYVFEEIHVKDKSGKRKKEIVGRIIGTHGKTKKILEDLTESFIVIRDSEVGVISPAEEVKDLIQAIENLIHGSKQGNVYGFLEKCRRQRKVPSDLGLKS